MITKETNDGVEGDHRTYLIKRLKEYKRFRNDSEKIKLLQKFDLLNYLFLHLAKYSDK